MKVVFYFLNELCFYVILSLGKCWPLNSLLKWILDSIFFKEMTKDLAHFRPMLHLWTNQVVGFYCQNVWKTQGRVTLKCHSSTGVFQTFCQYKSATWFLHKWNISRTWVYKQLWNKYFEAMQYFRIALSRHKRNWTWYFFYNKLYVRHIVWVTKWLKT